MSINTFLQTIETDIKKDVDWAKAETEDALLGIWSAAKPIFTAAEPVVVQGLLTELGTFLTAASADVKGGEASYIATVFLATLKDTGHALAGEAEAIGTDLLTVLAGLAKTAAAAV